jgi:hypothetical protein
VDPVAVLVPGADGVDRTRVGLGGQDVLHRVRLDDALVQVLAWELRDGPGALLGVREGDAVAALGDLVEQAPVLVERRVDVDCYARHGLYRTRS